MFLTKTPVLDLTNTWIATKGTIYFSINIIALKREKYALQNRKIDFESCVIKAFL